MVTRQPDVEAAALWCCQATKRPVLVPIWDCSSVKNTLDDTFRQALLEHCEEYEASYAEEDLKLWIAGVACVVAGGACLYGLFVPHPQSSPVVGLCVGLYFAFMLLLNGYSMLFDSHLTLLAKRSNETGTSLLKMVTLMERFSPNYKVQLAFVLPSGETLESDCTVNVGQFFYEDGELSEESVTAVVKALVAEAHTNKTKAS